MLELKISADELVGKLLSISESETVCVLDSCGVGESFGAYFLIAGIRPLEILELTGADPEQTLKLFDFKLSDPKTANIFTISYDFGVKLEKIEPARKKNFETHEPDIFLASFECLITHDYRSGKTYLRGDRAKFSEVEKILEEAPEFQNFPVSEKSRLSSNFTKREYVQNVRTIQEFIRRGDTYQTNLTQQFQAELPAKLTAQKIFQDLRLSHPAPYAAFIKRKTDFVISISPERFAEIRFSKTENDPNPATVKLSPIKGTRPRGRSPEEDSLLKKELAESAKDRAENVMIVDLIRNDIGRICEFGSVSVEKLCELEIHPSIFHLVSTVSGRLKKSTGFGEIIRAIFPCGSITGCPKISTMRIIENIETVRRGLSMGAVGFNDFDRRFGLSVAIRTLTVRENQAVFSAGGGIVIDSDPEAEYLESLHKARAIFRVLNADFDFSGEKDF